MLTAVSLVCGLTGASALRVRNLQADADMTEDDVSLAKDYALRHMGVSGEKRNSQQSMFLSQVFAGQESLPLPAYINKKMLDRGIGQLTDRARFETATEHPFNFENVSRNVRDVLTQYMEAYPQLEQQFEEHKRLAEEAQRQMRMDLGWSTIKQKQADAIISSVIESHSDLRELENYIEQGTADTLRELFFEEFGRAAFHTHVQSLQEQTTLRELQLDEKIVARLEANDSAAMKAILFYFNLAFAKMTDPAVTSTHEKADALMRAYDLIPDLCPLKIDAAWAAQEITPLLEYVIVQLNSPGLRAETEYLLQMVGENFHALRATSKGEEQYVLTTMKAVFTGIEKRLLEADPEADFNTVSATFVAPKGEVDVSSELMMCLRSKDQACIDSLVSLGVAIPGEAFDMAFDWIDAKLSKIDRQVIGARFSHKNKRVMGRSARKARIEKLKSKLVALQAEYVANARDTEGLAVVEDENDLFGDDDVHYDTHDSPMPNDAEVWNRSFHRIKSRADLK